MRKNCVQVATGSALLGLLGLGHAPWDSAKTFKQHVSMKIGIQNTVFSMAKHGQ